MSILESSALLPEENLASYTSWRVGGAAGHLFVPQNATDLAEALSDLPLHVPVTFLGLGSNVLIRDGGLPGWVVWTQKGLHQLKVLSDRVIWAEAGVPTAKLARLAAEKGYGEAAFWAGIPGTVGGSLQMNAGAFGHETWEFVQSVQVVDRRGRIFERPASDYVVGYRHVVLNHPHVSSEPEWFLGATFVFPERDDDGTMETRVQVAKDQIREMLKYRNEKQPIGLPSGGSVFKNPKPHFAGRLIEEAGLKGWQVGGAVVSDKHANFIVNTAQATAADIENLIEFVREKVFAHAGIWLETEVKILGQKKES